MAVMRQSLRTGALPVSFSVASEVNHIDWFSLPFQEFAVAKGDLQMKIPDNLSDEQAASLGVGLTTVGLALYQSLEMHLPPYEPHGIPVLIYGGSTATGSLAIQFAAL